MLKLVLKAILENYFQNSFENYFEIYKIVLQNRFWQELSYFVSAALSIQNHLQSNSSFSV